MELRPDDWIEHGDLEDGIEKYDPDDSSEDDFDDFNNGQEDFISEELENLEIEVEHGLDQYEAELNEELANEEVEFLKEELMADEDDADELSAEDEIIDDISGDDIDASLDF